MSTRTSSRKISASIARLAAQDLLDSDDELMDDPDADVDVDLTLVASDGEEEEEETGKEQHDQEKSQGSGSGKEGESEEEDEEIEGDTGEDESEEESEEEEEEEVRVPQKRKHSGSGKSSSKKADSAREIEYKIAIFSAEQMRKKKSARGHPVTEIVTLLSNKPWADLNSHILSKIDAVLDPGRLNLSDYSITFTVPRQVSEPIHLDATKYEYLVKKALLIKTNPSAKIIVELKESRAGEKENDETGDEETKQGGKKTKVPKARDILPGNVALNAKIGELRERWKCPTEGGPCGSTHCYFNATHPDHFPLSHEQFQSWGAAALKGKAFADVETPPNNKLFDSVAAGARAAQSPLLQRRLELQQQTSAKNYPSIPQVNINFPAEFANFLRPPAPAPAPVTPNAFFPPPNISNMLIPYPRTPGDDLSIQDFCSLYDLDDDICERFIRHKYKGTKSFTYTEVDELKEMGFLRGEIAELKVAVAQWSQPGNME